ncbi:MAG: flagellin lysine-N-methylase [Lachnospiraceae bacterium]|nr:flagellin lysine-N-methylase [Lachnospiraceae bacterium]
MQMKRISILNEFKCTGSECSASCCRGWKVPIERDMYLKYLHEKGLFGTLLRCSIEKKDDIVAFRSTFRGCPFWGIDRLCSMQKKHGAEYMPAVCVQFPRQLYNLDFFCEETLYLACPEAARLFLVSVDEEKPFEFAVCEGSPSYAVNTTNDDKEFLDYLLQSRDELAALVRNGMRFDSMAILDYGRDAQNACLDKTPLPSPSAYQSSEYYAIGIERMNKLFFNGFYHPSLRTLSPFLYRLCQKYIRRFGILSRINPASSNQKLHALTKNLEQKIPNLNNLLNRYYEYYLFTNFLDIFEDYSFSKHLVFGVAKTAMLRLFLALYAEHKKQISTNEIAKIIAVYERRAPQIEDALRWL